VDQAGGNATPLRGPKGQDIVVNDQFKNLNEPGSGYHQGSDEEAQAYTNRTGIPALAIQPNPKGHGHIVPLVPEVFPGQPHPEGWSPQVNNIGRRVGITTADDAFPNKNLPMYYFVPDK
jgi:hypothetical protein